MKAKISSILIVFALFLSACSAKTVVAPVVVKSTSVAQQAQPIAAPAEAPLALPTAAPLVLYTVPTAAPGPVSTPADTFFTNYGVNPYTNTREDHLSTFALDVDTASYSLARSYINEGLIPPVDAIRVEEFINYFEQGYPAPEEATFAIYADGTPSPFLDDGTYLVRIGIQGYRLPEAERAPLTLTFVIDVSGSMSQDNRLELVKQALALLVDRLRPDDTVGIVAYSSEARVVLYPTAGSERRAILEAINSLYPENSTNAEAGLRLGYQLAMQYFRAGTTNRVILASDGVANVGATGPQTILDEVRGYVDEGVTLTTVGVGMGNYNDVLLEQLADNGDGNYAYVDTLDEARKVFVEDLVSTMQVIARDAKVQVDFNADVVERYRLIGYENRAVADEDFRNDAVDAGEIGAGHSATALYAVQLRPGAQGRLATVQLRWQEPQSYAIVEINHNLNTSDLAASFDDTSSYYQMTVVVAQFAEVLRHSPYAAGSEAWQLVELANRLPRSLEDARVLEFAQLVSRSAQLGALGR